VGNKIKPNFVNLGSDMLGIYISGYEFDLESEAILDKVFQKKRKEVIDDILLSENPKEALDIFHKNINLLKGVRAIIFDDKFRAKNSQSLANKRFGKYSIFGIGNYQKACLLSQDIVVAMMDKNGSGQAPIWRSFCVNLDTNVVSHLSDLYYKNNRDNDDDLNQLLLHIKKVEAQTTISPYLIENAFNESKIDEKITKEVLLANLSFEEMQYEDVKNKKFNLINPNFSDKKRIEEQWKSFATPIDKIPQYEVIYILLMKVFIIKQRSPKNASFKNQTKQLINFINDELSIYLEMETVLSLLYLKNDKDVMGFFGKLQLGAKGLLSKFRNTAYDLFLFRLMIDEMAERINNDSEFYFHSFVSHDGNLQKVLELNPLSRIVFDNSRYHARFEKNIHNIGLDESNLKRYSKYSTTRTERFGTIDLSALSLKLEQEVNELIKS